MRKGGRWIGQERAYTKKKKKHSRKRKGKRENRVPV